MLPQGQEGYPLKGVKFQGISEEPNSAIFMST